MPNTLCNFPEGFDPLVVVTGDRREIPPKSNGDLLAYSVSCTDFWYLNGNKLGDALVLSDKQFVVDDDDTLRRRFGEKNMLVIGSPAVNLLSRRINDRSLFRFSITQETKEELFEQDELIKEIAHSDEDLYIYYQCLEGVLDIDSILLRFKGDPDIDGLRNRATSIVNRFKKTKICSNLAIHRRPIRYLMHKLDIPGIYDSLSKTIRGTAMPQNRDYGLISLLPNPFSREQNKFYIIYVAGVHGPGTALGLKLLSQKIAFEDHPYGGVFEVNLRQFASYFEKLSASKARWETGSYSINDASPNVVSSKMMKVFLSSPSGHDNVQEQFDTLLKQRLENIASSKRIEIEVQTPYTLPFSGPADFWDVVINYEKDCSFIIHDVTGTARGVLVEIGFSFGRKKQRFLIWNTSKKSITSYEQMNMPSLLSTMNVLSIKGNDTTNLDEILEKQVLSPALDRMTSNECTTCGILENKTKKKKAFIYSREKKVRDFIVNVLHEHEISQIREEDSDLERKICKICQVMQTSDYAIIDIAEDDPNSYIILGIAKALAVPTFVISLEKLESKSFPWASGISHYRIESISESISAGLTYLFRYRKESNKEKQKEEETEIATMAT